MPDAKPVDPRTRTGCDLSTERGRQNAATLRAIMNRVGMWPHCPRRACRRARACMDDHVRCFFLHHETMRELLYPMLREHAARRAARADGEPGAD